MNSLERNNIDLLRLSVIGSVDDGKSTLIGRLLYDSKSIFEDQLLAIKESSKKRGGNEINLALLTDGLKAEREQGITIDVAYRYFSTPKRKFIIADCPGHIQYTRNMVTGTSNVNLAVILVDARYGVVEQTKRHAFIASLMQVKHLILCINKMDLLNYSEDKFNSIKKGFGEFASKLSIPDIRVIPISALDGDNIVNKSPNMPWYNGSTLLYTLEDVHLGSEHNFVDSRFPIQRVIRPQSEQYRDFRGYAGRVEGGVFKVNDKVTLLPSGFSTTITSIETMDGQVKEAFHPMSVVMNLNGDFDLSRGDMLVKENNQPKVSQDIHFMICWFGYQPLRTKGKYILKHTTSETRCMIKSIHYKIDIHTLHRDLSDSVISLNDIGRISIRTSQPIFIDEFNKCKQTGSAILIDEKSNETVAACMVL